MIIRYGYAHVRTDKVDEVRERALQLEKLTNAEPGCLDYRFSWTFENPTQLCLIECWHDPAAYSTHTAKDYVAEFGEFMKTAVTAPPAFTGYDATPQTH